MLGLPWGSSGRRRCGGGARLGRGHGAERLGFRQGGKGGRGGAGGRGGGPYAPEGGARHEEVVRGVHGGEEIVAAVSSLSPQEEDPDRWVPLSGSSPFLFPFLFPVAFRELIEAFNQF